MCGGFFPPLCVLYTQWVINQCGLCINKSSGFGSSGNCWFHSLTYLHTPVQRESTSTCTAWDKLITRSIKKMAAVDMERKSPTAASYRPPVKESGATHLLFSTLLSGELWRTGAQPSGQMSSGQWAAFHMQTHVHYHRTSQAENVAVRPLFFRKDDSVVSHLQFAHSQYW